MEDLDSELWRSVFAPDQGTLLNIRIYGTDQTDHEAFLELVQSRYRISYSENGMDKALPEYEEIVQNRKFCSVRLSVDVGSIVLNSFFWDTKEINLDLLPEDIDSLPKANSVFELMKTLASHLKKPVLLTGENASATQEWSEQYAICVADPFSDQMSFR